ncbi:hypothetical protein BDV12DRAFT_166132 [Aspergillus spectabilis]
MLKVLEDLGIPVLSDSKVRTRILERYYHFGRRDQKELRDKLPRSERSVFTHGDIAPRNIMIDEQNKITDMLRRTSTGWYPDYWEYAQMF